MCPAKVREKSIFGERNTAGDWYFKNYIYQRLSRSIVTTLANIQASVNQIFDS